MLAVDGKLGQPHFLGLGGRPGSFSGTSRKATVASAGNVQFSCVATVAVPDPPYRADSLDHSVSHSKPSGGASNGSGIGLSSRFSPKFTTSNRSSLLSSLK